MKILLLQLDGSQPNIALMRLSAHHKAKGDAVMFEHAHEDISVLERGFWDDWDLVYASTIFTRNKPLAKRLCDVFPAVRIGGTGWDLGKDKKDRMTLERIGITTRAKDYSIYPDYPHSIGYTQRGCRLACEFCDVQLAEGKVSKDTPIHGIWRGQPHPRNVCLLDNDFFGEEDWRDRICEIKDGNFRVCFNQGINVRLISDEQASAIASVRYSDDQFKERRLYTAWDNAKDERALFRGLDRLVKHGVRPDDIMVYMLIGFWEGPQLVPSDFHRHARLREFGCRPYPMPFDRTNRELAGFQRYVVKRIDVAGVSWEEFKAVKFRPERLGNSAAPSFDFEEHDEARASVLS